MATIGVNEKLYRAQATFFERPLVSNHPYEYKLVGAYSPFDFMVSVKDALTEGYEKKLQKLLVQYQEGIKEASKLQLENCRIDPGLFYVGMPVLIKVDCGSAPEVWSLARGEVLDIKGNVLNIMMVDLHGVVSKIKDDVFPITVDILRIPKLGVQCSLAQIRPSGGKQSWPKDRDYIKDFTGNDSQIVTFMDYFPKSKCYESVLEVDKVNVALRYFHEDVAVPIQVDLSRKEGEIKGYPVPDYAPWLGLKVVAFGVKAFRDVQHGGKLKCVIQLDPDSVNVIQDKIANYINSVDDAVRRTPFSKQIGTPCLALYGEEYFRSTILKKENDNEYLVEYVDYKERQIVPASNLLQIPAELLDFPEGAVVCQLTDLLTCENFTDDQKLRDLVDNKDLYAVIDACDPEILGSELLVSLYEPVDFTGPDRSFGEILGISQKPPIVREILQLMEPVDMKLAEIFLTQLFLEPDEFYPGVMVMVSVINDWNSIWVQLENVADLTVALSTELTQFYQNGGCPSEVYEKFMREACTGRYVAARQEEDQDDVFYRAQVMKEQDGKLQLLYIDFGNTEWVEKNRTYPLHKYFIKDQRMAFEVELKMK